MPQANEAVDAVLLDLGGVFYLPDHERMLAALARLGVSAAAGELDRGHYAGVAVLDDHLAGPDGVRSVWHAYNRAYAQAFGVAPEHIDDAMDLLLEEFGRGDVWTREIPGAREALHDLAAAGVALAVVSNADGTVEQQLRDDGICQVGPGPGVEVGAIVDSRIVGVSKPDPAIFHLALDALGVGAGRAIHVGDMPAADVAGARAAGIRPVLVDPFDRHRHLDCLRVTHLRGVVELVAPR